MDDKKLFDLLNRYYDWTYPYVSSEEAKFERIKPCRQNKDYKNLEPNEQLGPRIIGLKKDVCLKPCEWCHKQVNQSTLHKLISLPGKHKKEWQHTCVTCRKSLDPVTGLIRPTKISKYQQEKEKAEAAAKIKEHWWNKLIGGIDNKD